MDCAFSNYTHHFSSAHAASFDLVNQARANVDYVRLMDHVAAAAPGLMCQVRYETLLDHPERELRRVLDYLDLDWTEDLLTFHESDRTVRTPSAEQVRRPLNRSGVGSLETLCRVAAAPARCAGAARRRVSFSSGSGPA